VLRLLEAGHHGGELVGAEASSMELSCVAIPLGCPQPVDGFAGSETRRKLTGVSLLAEDIVTGTLDDNDYLADSTTQTATRSQFAHRRLHLRAVSQ
jgi:hypothetical protein